MTGYPSDRAPVGDAEGATANPPETWVDRPGTVSSTQGAEQHSEPPAGPPAAPPADTSADPPTEPSAERPPEPENDEKGPRPITRERTTSTHETASREESPTSIDPVLVNPPDTASKRRPHMPRLRDTWRGDTPTDPMPMVNMLRRTPYRDARVTHAAAEEREAREAMDLALRVGEVLLRCGAGAPQVESSVVAVAMASGLDNLDIDITLQSLLMQSTTPSGQRITLLRVVRSPRRDFARLAAVHGLVDDLVSGQVDREQATRQLRIITRMRRTWSSWVVTLAYGLLSAGVALTLGAGWAAVLASLASAMAVDRVITALSRREIPDFYQSAVGGFLATVIAWAAYALGVFDWVPISPADFAYIVAGGIVVLLPARTIASAMEDVITGYAVTGTSRIWSVLFHTLGLIIGVGSGLGVTFRIGQVIHLNIGQPPIERMAWASAPFVWVVIGAAIIGVSGAVTLQCRRRDLLPVALLCVLGVVATFGLTTVFGIGRVTSVGLAAIFLGFVGRLLAIRLDAPGMVYIVPATFGLLPGLSIFVALYRLVVRMGSDQGTDLTFQVGLTALIAALGILMALATGSTFGEILATPLDHGVVERRRMRRGSHRQRPPKPVRE